MLDVFRSAAKTWVVKILFLMLVASFLLWGVGDVVRRGINFGPAIKVGDASVSAGEVNAEFKREVDRLQPLFGGKLTAADARRLGLMDRTIDTIVTRTLIDEAARELGLTASDAAVLRQIAANPRFRNELGQFDRDVMGRIIARSGLSEDAFMRAERADFVRSQMASALAGGVQAPDVLIDPLVRWRQERRVAEIVLVRDDSVPLPAAPDAASLDAFYKAATARFMAPEYRALTVLFVRPSDVAEQINVSPEMVAQAYQQRLEEFVTPERRQISQIVLTDDAEVARAAAMAREGKDLSAIAKALDEQVVELGWIEKGELPEDLGKPVFQQAAGKVGMPLKSEFGTHFVRVEAITPGRTRQLAEVKGQLEQDLKREKALDMLGELSNKVEDTLAGGSTIEEVAKRFSLKTLKIAAIDAQGRGSDGKPVPGIPKGDGFLDTAFHTEPNTDSQMTENDGDGVFMVRVDGVTPPAPKPLADIRSDVVAAWQAERRHEAARERADKVAEQLKGAAALATAAQGFKTQVSRPFARDGADGAGLPPTVVSELFQATPGGVSMGAVQGGWVVARLAKVVPLDAAGDNDAVATAKRAINGAVASDLIDQYITALRTSLGVKVDRDQLVREEQP
ncbi:MAG: SurA N-terminal domain-containing protein [Magnetospirillum sp.]|nr:SurA N-terminal domain-containing protein [Magnetospirillum sp.]